MLLFSKPFCVKFDTSIVFTVYDIGWKPSKQLKKITKKIHFDRKISKILLKNRK